MAHTIALSAAQTAQLANQIGGKLATSRAQGAPGAGVQQTITETFPIFALDDRYPVAPGAGAPLMKLPAYNTGMLHHNVSEVPQQAPGGAAPVAKVVAAATSRIQPNGSLRVDALSFSSGTDLQRQIRNTAYWVDTNASGDPFVSMVIVPSRYIHCFCLSYPNEDKIVVIDMPKSFTHLQYGKIYTVEEFYREMALEPATSGVGQ